MICIQFGFIGAGKVAVSLGKYFRVNNLDVIGYCSKSSASSLEAAKITNSTSFFTIKELVEKSDCIFIATPDDQILKVWNNLKKLDIENKIICHFSGVLTSHIFEDINKFGAYGYSIHPLLAFSDKYSSYKQLNNSVITIEGHPKYIKELKEVFYSLGNNVKIIKESNKIKYHCASVISSNFFVALMELALKYMEQCGFERNEALEALEPLVINNIKNIILNDTKYALTGPVERGDIGTIKLHCEELSMEDKKIYKILSNELLKIAVEKNEFRNYKKIEEFLRE